MANSKPESRLIKAAGAVAWRPGPNGGPEILLVHRKKYDDWSLPKGKVEPGEQLPVTAVREVLEEGGAHLTLGRRLASVRYNVGGRPKRVHYWSAAIASLDERAIPNDEVDRIEWVDADRAVDRVSYRHDHGVLAEFARLPAQTVPVILLRHAHAVSKSNWKRADDRRPLDDSGRADAKALAELLACFGPRARLITSPAARCVETLRPFAEMSGAELREEPSLYIHAQSSRTDPADSSPSIAALIGEAIAAGEPTVFCAHRENIAVLQAAALAALGLDHPAAAADAGTARADTARAGTARAGTARADTARADTAPAGPAWATIPELPKEWDDPLPTSGFWVLNLTLPPPAPPASAPPAASSAPVRPESSAPGPSASSAPGLAASAAPSSAESPATASPPAPAWRRWWRIRIRIRTRPPRPVASPPQPLAAPVMAPDAPPEPSGPPRPAAPRLISADRYDLSEL
jgi:8-oxo-(d)GTP phosphatase